MKLYHKGQSLTEILVALSIGVVFINVGILAMLTTNLLARVNKANNYALALLESQKSSLETIIQNNWHSIDSLNIGKHYKLTKQNGSLVIGAGEEKIFDEKPPVAQWAFDEGAGTVAYDNVGTNNGTLVNAPTWQSAPNCVNGSCLGFFGGAQYVDVGTDPKLTPNNITLSAWVNATSVDTWNGIISNMTAWGTGFGLQMGTAQNIAAMVSGSYLKTTWAPTANTWYYIVATHDSTTNLNVLYVNGSEEARSTKAISYESNPKTYIGAFYTSPNLLFNGRIDEVSIYNYVLNAGQVKQHYNAGLNRMGLVAQWSLDEGSGTIAYDSQGAHNGTLVSGPSWQTAGCVAGGCLGFDGVDDRVQAGTGNDYFPLYNFSVCAWIKTPGLATGMTENGIFSLTYGLVLEIDSYNHPTLRLDNGSAIVNIVDGVSRLNDNQYHYICATVSNGQANLFVDGAVKAAQSVVWPGTTQWPTNACNIGMDNNNSSKYIFNGLIDEVRIYNRALSPDEIANQYKDGYTRYFYVNNVSRSIASDPTVSTHNLETTYNKDDDDPNTKKIINVTRYMQGVAGRVNSQEELFARAVNAVNSLVQLDWSGASGVEGPVIDPGNSYASSNNINTSIQGQISLTSTSGNGTLTSSVLDTQVIDGAGYLSLLWQGDALCTGCSVKFQIAASNTNTGPWTYYGPTLTSDYYVPAGANVTVPITYAGQYSSTAASIQNKRYIRYQLTIIPYNGVSPVVKNVIINYAP